MASGDQLHRGVLTASLFACTILASMKGQTCSGMFGLTSPPSLSRSNLATDSKASELPGILRNPDIILKLFWAYTHHLQSQS